MNGDNLRPWDADFFRRKTMRLSHDQEKIGPERFFEIYSQTAAGGVTVFQAELLKNVSFSSTTGALKAIPTGQFFYIGDPSGASHSTGAIVRATKLGPNWWIGAGGGSSACDTIRFAVGSSPAPLFVVGEILAVPVGCNPLSLPGAFLIGGTPLVNICDPLGCFFNEPTGELINRTGWARYMQPVGPNTCQPSNYYPQEPQWEVFSLCCSAPACG